MQALLFEENTVKYRCLLKQNKKKKVKNIQSEYIRNTDDTQIKPAQLCLHLKACHEKWEH